MQNSYSNSGQSSGHHLNKSYDTTTQQSTTTSTAEQQQHNNSHNNNNLIMNGMTTTTSTEPNICSRFGVFATNASVLSHASLGLSQSHVSLIDHINKNVNSMSNLHDSFTSSLFDDDEDDVCDENVVSNVNTNTSNGSTRVVTTTSTQQQNGCKSYQQKSQQNTNKRMRDTSGTNADNNTSANQSAKRGGGSGGSSAPNGKKTKGRVKIKMEFIDNKLRRYTTFSKRKTGIMKKAYELSTLTGTQVMLLVASETGHVYTFATRKLQPMITSDAGKLLIQTCLNSDSSGGQMMINGNGGQSSQSLSTSCPQLQLPPQCPTSTTTTAMTSSLQCADNSAANSRMSANGYEEVDLTYQVITNGNASSTTTTMLNKHHEQINEELFDDEDEEEEEEDDDVDDDDDDDADVDADDGNGLITAMIANHNEFIVNDVTYASLEKVLPVPESSHNQWLSNGNGNNGNNGSNNTLVLTLK